MKRTIALLAVMALGVAAPVYALYGVTEHGAWPKSWPAKLEPLRKQSRTLVGPAEPLQHHAIPFTKREAFEKAWPYLHANNKLLHTGTYNKRAHGLRKWLPCGVRPLLD